MPLIQVIRPQRINLQSQIGRLMHRVEPSQARLGSEFAIAKGGKGDSMKSFIDFEVSLSIVNYECVERWSLDQES